MDFSHSSVDYGIWNKLSYTVLDMSCVITRLICIGLSVSPIFLRSTLHQLICILSSHSSTIAFNYVQTSLLTHHMVRVRSTDHLKWNPDANFKAKVLTKFGDMGIHNLSCSVGAPFANTHFTKMQPFRSLIRPSDPDPHFNPLIRVT